MFQQIGAHTWYMQQDVRTDRPSIGYIKGDKYSFAVEACASPAHVALFYDKLKENGLPLPDFTGISHFHWDHSYGACAVNGLTIASARCNEMLRREAKWGWSEEEMLNRVAEGLDIRFGYVTRKLEYPDPKKIKVVPADIEVTGDAVIDLGGVTVQIINCGGPHSEDQLMFYVPEDKVLYVGDANTKDLHNNVWVYDEEHPERLQEDIGKLPHFMDRLRPYVELMEKVDFEKCVQGHVDYVADKKEVMDTMRAYL